MAIEERMLELTIISAQDLKKVSTFGHDSSYAVAYIYSGDRKTTSVDSKGRESPRWNTKLSLTCDEKLLHQAGAYIIVEIYHYGSFSNKLVGTSRISLLDVGKLVGSTKPKSMELEVLRPSGKVKGVLNVSVKVGDKFTVIQRNYPAQGYQIYPPYTHSKPGSEFGFANANGAYPPSKASSDPSAPVSSDSKAIEPVTAYPVDGYPTAYPPQANGQQYDPQYYGRQYPGQYAGPQQYYYGPPPQGYAPYGYQNQYPAPSRNQGSSSGSSGLGLIGGLLGGLLVGEVIGGLF
jgi:hypothetical protein